MGASRMVMPPCSGAVPTMAYVHSLLGVPFGSTPSALKVPTKLTSESTPVMAFCRSEAAAMRWPPGASVVVRTLAPESTLLSTNRTVSARPIAGAAKTLSTSTDRSVAALFIVHLCFRRRCGSSVPYGSVNGRPSRVPLPGRVNDRGLHQLPSLADDLLDTFDDLRAVARDKTNAQRPRGGGETRRSPFK